MRFNPGILAVFGLVSVAACGTVTVEMVPQAPSTPTLVAQSSPEAGLSPSPEECSTFQAESTLPENPDDPGSYINHHYNELAMPEGLAFVGGGLLNDTTLWEWVSRPAFDMEFLSQTICHKLDGSPYNIVVDAVIIPREREGYVRADACSPEPSAGPVIVFGKVDAALPETTLLGLQGWKMYDLDFGKQIDLRAMRFQPLPLDGLECIHSSGLGG